jgi:hypothetical protein
MREAVSRGASFVLVVGSAAALLTLPPAPPPTTLAQAATPYVTLAERAVLPADSFAPGPPSGAAITGNTNGRSVPFASPPVQGISAVVPLGGSAYLVLMPLPPIGVRATSRLRAIPSCATPTGACRFLL